MKQHQEQKCHADSGLGASYVLEFELPGLPKTTNAIGRAHWAVKVREVRSWTAAVMALIAHKRPLEPLSRATLTLTRFSSAEPDYDNLVISFKPVIDALVRAQVLTSDKPSVIGQPEYRWEKAKPRQGMIRVRVEEI